MSRRATVHDILPLVAELSPRERIRLVRLMITRRDFDEAALYTAIPPGRDEFSSDEQPLAWESDGWEEVREALLAACGFIERVPSSD